MSELTEGRSVKRQGRGLKAEIGGASRTMAGGGCAEAHKRDAILCAQFHQGQGGGLCSELIASPLKKQFQESHGERPMEKGRKSKGGGMAKVTVVFRSWVVRSWEQKSVEEMGERKGLWFHFSRE